MRPVIVVTVSIALSAIGLLQATEPGDQDIAWRIRREATDRSQILQTLHVLTDVYGPRLTGSPNLEEAGKWARDQLGQWGLVSGRLEPWDFGHAGWTNERVSAFVVEPVKDTLTVEVVAWTPSTPGTVVAPAVQIVPPERPTAEELTAYLARVGPTLRGKVVLVGQGDPVPVSFSPVAKRRELAEVRAQYDPDDPAPSPFARMAQPQQAEGPKRLSADEIDRQINAAFVDHGAAVRVNDAGREHGQVRAFNNRTFDLAKAVPTVVLRNEDFGRIVRLLAGNRPVQLEFTIVNRDHPAGRTAYNLVAEIPGSDKADEIVMLGAHLDSLQSATGATDNAIGAAVMMEAARILKAVGAKPRRTIRIALWAGEEQGLLGSLAYVKEHFGTFEQPKPGFDKLAAYFNLDSGTGRVRGATVFGPPEAAGVVRAALAPLTDLGVAGATHSSSRRRGGSDHTSFSEAGLPGISMGQDPIEYMSHTWHTNLDTYERVVPEDAISSAIAVAVAVHHVATRDELLPRFAKDKMPAPPAPSPEAPRPTTPAGGPTR